MRGLWKKFALGMLAWASLTTAPMAAFIQSPIPPSTRENYLLDTDNDGRVDLVSIKFLGSVSRDYLDQMVDSLAFDWTNEKGGVIHVLRKAGDFVIDAESDRRVEISLADLSQEFQKNTGVSSDMRLGLYLKDSTVYEVHVRDQVAPVVKLARLRSHHGSVNDTLDVSLSERVSLKSSCNEFVEYKSALNGAVETLFADDAAWNESETGVTLVLKKGLSTEISPRDSIRLRSGCVEDSAGNVSSERSPFAYVNGYYPLDYESRSMVTAARSDKLSDGRTLPIFQLMFANVGEGAEYPNESEWGIAMDLMTPEFLNAVKAYLNMGESDALDPSLLRIQCNVRIYTNLGDFVVASTADVLGNDARLENTAKRMFLKWNLMDATRRHVATGAYIAHIAVAITYGDRLVYRSDLHHGPTAQIFGVKRR